jgi:hypothetical protein
MTPLVGDDLNAMLGEAIAACARKGMRPPFLLVAISPNGSMFATRIGQGGNETLVNHIAADGPQYPLTVVVVDQDNEAMKFKVTAQDKVQH